MTPEFAADRTLGKLAKWLRLMGFDTLFEGDAAGGGFREAAGRNRILLTRMRRRRGAPAAETIFIESDDPRQQIREVIAHLNLDPSLLEPFSRCLRCNQKLDNIDPVDAYGRVPDYIWETHADFSRCPGCGRIFWPGSHVQRSRRQLAKLFSAGAAGEKSPDTLPGSHSKR